MKKLLLPLLAFVAFVSIGNAVNTVMTNAWFTLSGTNWILSARLDGGMPAGNQSFWLDVYGPNSPYSIYYGSYFMPYTQGVSSYDINMSTISNVYATHLKFNEALGTGGVWNVHNTLIGDSIVHKVRINGGIPGQIGSFYGDGTYPARRNHASMGLVFP